MKLCTKFERNRAIRGRVNVISIFDLMTLNVMCCARLWDNFIQILHLTTYLYLIDSALDADTLCHAVTLTFDPGSSFYMRRRVIKIWTKFKRIVELLIILRILHTLCHAMTLTFDLFTLNFYRTSGVMC